MVAVDISKSRIDLIIRRTAEKQFYISDEKIYASVAQHLNKSIDEVMGPTKSALEQMVSEGKMAQYNLRRPFSAYANTLLDDKRTVPERLYKWVQKQD